MNRGSSHDLVQIRAGEIASMRPRFMNRGSVVLAVAVVARVAASMRPRFMNRGSHPSPGGRIRGVRRFNEAPIHESGKSRCRSPAPTRTTSFNEAPIHESGKSAGAELQDARIAALQ